MDFASFKEQVGKISGLIVVDAFSPDLIVGVARGGWVPALLLSRLLGVKKLCSYGLGYADKARTVIQVYQRVDPADDVRNILVVEDFLESGKCIKYATEELATRGRDVRTVALGYLEKTLLIPTYSLGRVEEIPPMPWDDR
ncbi:MAG: phosphoribosyltransferase family protein [Alphaproteobacteria bacterium]|nr:phosphoribosyltransferase family protein [Alphaproteobacteria bacterium]